MAQPAFGSRPTHTLMSYFSSVQLEIVTFLEGERKVDRPINKYFKELKLEHIRGAHDVLAAALKEFE
jgi:hypothetical protein